MHLFIVYLQQQTKLEENELDDAISVFRNHCEPHPLGMPPNMDGSYGGPSPLVNSIGQTPQENNPTNEPPTTIKLERVPANSSEFLTNSKYRKYSKKIIEKKNPIMPNCWLKLNSIVFVVNFSEKRKEPPDVDTKPSSSSVDGSNKGGKRTRR